jgi:hypothetical protein
VESFIAPTILPRRFPLLSLSLPGQEQNKRYSARHRHGCPVLAGVVSNLARPLWRLHSVTTRRATGAFFDDLDRTVLNEADLKPRERNFAAVHAFDIGGVKVIMKIAQVAPLIEGVPPRLYGGTERVVSYLTEELVRLGHDVTLFASGDSISSAELASCCSRAALIPRCPTSFGSVC